MCTHIQKVADILSCIDSTLIIIITRCCLLAFACCTVYVFDWLRVGMRWWFTLAGGSHLDSTALVIYAANDFGALHWHTPHSLSHNPLHLPHTLHTRTVPHAPTHTVSTRHHYTRTHATTNPVDALAWLQKESTHFSPSRPCPFLPPLPSLPFPSHRVDTSLGKRHRHLSERMHGITNYCAVTHACVSACA